jgi:hypothetical protein
MKYAIVVIITCLLALSCSSEGEGPADQPAVPAATAPCAGAADADLTCASDAAALANLDRSLVTCHDDGDCPRGAYCALSACAYECARDTDCVHGRTCDARGRCR